MRCFSSVLVLLSLLVGTEALACGGCFSPPVSPTIDPTVLQDAERVLFLRDPQTKLSTVWVEVRYTGQAKDFGWVLPVPKLPKVGVGSVAVLDALDQAMRTQVDRKVAGPENCRSPADGCAKFEYPDALGFDTSSSSFADASPGGGGPQGVEIVASGQTGPYNYQVVKGSDAAALYTWLTDNGYSMPATAKPILESHVKKGDLFVAVKLQNGKGVNAIKPITLEMDDAEPCVPLRLTSIAAVEEMSVIVTLAGPGRAVVKNHLDVTLNPLRMAFPFGYGPVVPSNYAQLLAAAIDEASGHAFVTEYAQPGKATALESPFKGFSYANFSQMTTLYALAAQLANGALPVTQEIAEAFEPILHLADLFPGVTPAQTLANLRACVQTWQNSMGGPFGQPCFLTNGFQVTQATLQGTPIDGVALADEITKTFTGPIDAMLQQFQSAQTVTRLDMRISPTEMDRDPVFAWNPALPSVSPLIPVTLNQVCSDGWDDGDPKSTRVTFADLGTWVRTEQLIDDRMKTLPAAWHAQLLDEVGPQVEIDPKQAPLVAAAIAGATPGTPSLAKDLVLTTPVPWTPPASDPVVVKVGPWPKPLYCVPKPGWVNGQLPPTGQVNDLDASSGDGGTIPGVDALGGWNDVPADPPPEQTFQPSKSGCQAGTGSTSSGLALVFGLVVLAVARRRTRG